ncbi:hypothetical protein NFI96_027163, partial [Prochilodus magdalenae]
MNSALCVDVEELSSALKEKADWCSELLLGSEQLRREVEERNEEIEKLESRVRALEQALIANTDTLSTAEESKQYASMAAGDDATLEALLQTEREALDRKEKEIVNLEEQLEQFREELQNKSEEVQQLHMQLEIQRKEISTQQQELLAQTALHALEHPHTVPADGAVGVEVEGHQVFWTCDYRPFISVLTTVPPHTGTEIRPVLVYLTCAAECETPLAGLTGCVRLAPPGRPGAVMSVLEQKDREIALLSEHVAKLQLTESSPEHQ